MADTENREDNFIALPPGLLWPGEGEPPCVGEMTGMAGTETIPVIETTGMTNGAVVTKTAAADFVPTETVGSEAAGISQALHSVDPIDTVLMPDGSEYSRRRDQLHIAVRRRQRLRIASCVCLGLLLLCAVFVGAIYLDSTGTIDLQQSDSTLLNTVAGGTAQLADKVQALLPGETYSPLKRIGSESEFITAVHAARNQGFTSVTLTLTKAFYAQANQHRLAILSGMQSYQAAYIDSACRYLYEDITWTDRPVISCSSEQELQDAIRSMGQQDKTEFTLVFSPDFFHAVTALDWFSFRQLTGEAGLFAYNCCNYSSDACYITVMGAEIEKDVQLLTTVQDAFTYAEARASEEPDTIALYCSQDVYAQLTDARGTAEGTGLSYISDLMVACGILNGSWSMNGTSCVIRLKISAYYPGFRVAHAWQKGDTSGLTDREKQTYDAALTIAQQLQTGDTFSTAMAIHDHLCASVGYYTDSDTENEDDTATGALLNGWANCDGYADAFYAVGTMAGLTVRYQHGNTYDQADSNAESATYLTHAWNLLLLNGSWVHVDVTWDDRDDEYGYSHTWFAIGDDRMARTHYWNHNDTVSTAASTDLSLRPADEYTVSNDTQLQQAVHSAVDQGQSQITLFFENDMGLQTERTFQLLHAYGRNVDMLYSVDEHLCALTVYGIY